MPHDFIEERRRVKRLKKLRVLEEEQIKAKGGKGNVYQYTRTGYRNDLGLLFRSSWEANFARVLTIHGIKYEFEPETFWFPIKRGTKGYTPDFYFPATNERVEIKGYFDDKSRIKLKRYSKYYPEEFSNLYLLISRTSKKSQLECEKLGIEKIIYYEDFRDAYKPLIPGWEGR